MSMLHQDVLDHMRNLAAEFESEDAEYVLSLLFMELGLCPNHDGFDYLLKAVPIFINDPTVSFMNELYPAVAKMYGRKISVRQVEHSMCAAIKAALKNNNEAVWFRYFSPETDGKLKKPSNSEFISVFARVLELWKGCCKSQNDEFCKEDAV